MFRTTQAFIDRLESDGLKYKLLGKTHGGDEAVSLVFDGDEDAAELHLLCIFAQNGSSAALRILRAVQVAEGRHLDALIALQDCNARYRFVKFCFPGEDERSDGDGCSVSPRDAPRPLRRSLRKGHAADAWHLRRGRPRAAAASVVMFPIGGCPRAALSALRG